MTCMTSGALMICKCISSEEITSPNQVIYHTFFLRSGLFRVKAPAIIVSDTKSVYFSNSVAVNVDRASMNNSLARLNCRIESE